MKTLIAVASLTFLAVAAQPARAQGCCGSGLAYHVSCGTGCGGMMVYTCDAGADNSFYAPVQVECGSCGYYFDEYAPAGQCYNGAVVNPLQSITKHHTITNDTGAIYVDAFVRLCNGRYAAVRMPMARQAG